MDKQRSYSSSGTCLAVVITLLCLSVLFPLIGISSIGGSSEARESQVVSVILREGEWVLPLRNGLIPSKPPLFHWIAALVSMSMQRVDEFSTRLPSTFFGILILALSFLRAYTLARASTASRREHSFPLAFGAAAILASTYGYVSMLCDSRVDMTCSFFITLAVFSLLRRYDKAIENPSSPLDAVRNIDFVFFFIASGLAVLAKGPLGIVLPLFLVGVSAFSIAPLKKIFFFFAKPRLAWILFLLIAVPWYFLAAMKGHGDFVDRQLLFENVQRFFGGDSVNSEAFWFYGPSFLRIAFPWSLLFIAFLIVDIRALVGSRHLSLSLSSAESRYRSVLRVYVLCFLAGFVLFSMASGKRHSYLLPLFPYMAIFLSFAIHDWCYGLSDKSKAKLQKVFSNVPSVVAFLCFLSSLALLLVKTMAENAAFGKFSAAALVVLSWMADNAVLFFCPLFAIAISLYLLKTLFPKNVVTRYLVSIAAIVALSASLVTCGLGIKNYFKGFDVMAGAVSRVVGKEIKLQVVRMPKEEYFDPVLYYLNRKVELIKPDVTAITCTKFGVEPSFILARSSFFSDFKSYASNRGIRISVFGIYRERYDALKNKKGNESILFTCSDSI